MKLLEKERDEQWEVKTKAHDRIIEINLKLRQLNTLQKKVDAVLGNMRGDEIKLTHWGSVNQRRNEPKGNN